MITKMDINRAVGSLLSYQRVESVFVLLYSTLIYVLYELHGMSFLGSVTFPLGFLGTVLSVFLAFRNNSAYARWWEARILWGDLVNASRMFGAQVLSLITPPENSDLPEEAIYRLKKELILRHIAFVNLMRMQLREEINWTEVSGFLNEIDLERIRRTSNPAVQLNLIQSSCLRDAMKQGWLSDYRLISLQETLERFYNIIGACERIKNTPFPREYDGFIRIMIWVFILILPIYILGLFTDELSKMLVIPLSLVATLLVGFANKSGACLEDPFENRIHDIPMTSLCNTIERDLRQQLQDTSVPSRSKEVNGIVW